LSSKPRTKPGPARIVGDEARALTATTPSRRTTIPTTLTVSARPVATSTPDSFVDATMKCKVEPACRCRAFAKRPSVIFGFSTAKPSRVSAAARTWKPAPRLADAGAPAGAWAFLTNPSNPTPTPSSATDGSLASAGY